MPMAGPELADPQVFTLQDDTGLQVCAGRRLAGLSGRDGRPLAPHAGLALEPQFFPDAPNRAAWRALQPLDPRGIPTGTMQRWLTTHHGKTQGAQGLRQPI